MLSPPWCVITGCIGDGKKANANNVGRWVQQFLRITLPKSKNVLFLLYNTYITMCLIDELTIKLIVFVFLFRAFSRSLLFTVKRSWPSAAPGANRQWVCLESHTVRRIDRWLDLSWTTAKCRFFSDLQISKTTCILMVFFLFSTTTKCPASCCSKLRSLVQ